VTPTRRAAETAEISGMLNRLGKRTLPHLHDLMLRQCYTMAGYTPLEESMWIRFNRCCHPGRKIAIKDRVFYMRAGKIGDNLVIRRPPLSAAMADEVLMVSQ